MYIHASLLLRSSFAIPLCVTGGSLFDDGDVNSQKISSVTGVASAHPYYRKKEDADLSFLTAFP